MSRKKSSRDGALRLARLLEGLGSETVVVRNLTDDYITLTHPNPSAVEGSITIEPFSVVSIAMDYTATAAFQQQVSRGSLEEVLEEEAEEALASDLGRRKALEELRFDDPQVEAAARTVLLCPLDDLSDRATPSDPINTDGGKDWRMMALVVQDIIRFTPMSDDRVDVDYLKLHHSQFLSRLISREKIFRNRPAIIKECEKRAAEIEAMDALGHIRTT